MPRPALVHGVRGVDWTAVILDGGDFSRPNDSVPMNSPWFLAWIIVAGAALIQSFLLSLHAWEHRRFARSRIARPRLGPRRRRGRISVYAPCKGLDLELHDNLRPLFEQDYPDYELIFIVEAATDPACGTIRRLMESHPRVEARLLIAGQARHTGQKVHNLRQATRSLDPRVEVLAFVDSDARPGPQWLTMLTQRLDEPGCGAATGYRWLVPRQPTLSNLLLYSINTSAATLLGPGGCQLVWGGSWAIRRDVFERCAIREAWLGTLSDDLVATRVLRGHGLRVEFEPTCMVASPVSSSWRQSLDFLRRQFVIGKYYATRCWVLAFYGMTLACLGFWGTVVALVMGVWQGSGWTWLYAAMLASLQGWTLYRGGIRRDLAEIYLPQHRSVLRGCARIDTWSAPMLAVVQWLALVFLSLGRCITWRGVRYRLLAGGQVKLLSPRETARASDLSGFGPSSMAEEVSVQHESRPELTTAVAGN